MLVFFAALQQFGGYTSLPSTDSASVPGEIRPSSVTGSYLHYPLIMPILAAFLLQLYMYERKRSLLVISIVDLLFTVLSLSRSGDFILIAGFLLVFGASTSLKQRLALIYSALVAIVLFTTILSRLDVS